MEYNNRVFNKLVVLSFNKIKGITKGLYLNNPKSKYNRISINGNKNIVKVDNDSFIRDYKIYIDGNNNKVIINENTQIYGANHQLFFISGHNNTIVIGKNCIIRETSFFIKGNNNQIKLGDGISTIKVEYHIEQNDNNLTINDGCTFHGRESCPIHIALDESTSILIEEDCMFSNGIQMRSTDSHSIIDLSGNRLNYAKNIIIGKHCWIGLNAIILKGVTLSHNTVVAAGSICTSNYNEPNTVIAGNPAIVVKHSIDWDRKFL